MNREQALKIVLVVVGLIFSALVYPLVVFGRQEPAVAMMLSVYITLGIFLLLGGARSIGKSQLDRFRSVVKPGSRRLYGVSGFSEFDPARRTGGSGRAGHHRSNPARAGSSKAYRRAGVRSRCIRVILKKNWSVHQIAGQESAHCILHEVSDHAGAQATAPLREQAESGAEDGDAQHEFPALIAVRGAEGDAL
jgi:hypothetical protein